jgi:1-acyl-sn-glycerol-3-phosphate acyltransferase
MTFVRSIIFNIVFYVFTVTMVLVTLPVFVFASEKMTERTCRLWGSIGLFLLRTIVGTRLEIRGAENIPPGGVIVASKHQSMFETFALFMPLERTTYVMKQELARIPLWGWYAKRAGMIMLQRDQGASALRKLVTAVRTAIKKERQVIIFPEGTRQPPGASPDYKGGIAHLYRMSGAPAVPVALNSGLFWPRRRFTRYPGTIIFEFLPPIMPGLKSRDFIEQLQTRIETASDRLLVETSEAPLPPPFPPEAAARLKELTGS